MRKLPIILILSVMLLKGQQIKAQQLSQDPLYELVFVDDFDSLDLRNKSWDRNFPWSKANWKNVNYFIGCSNNGFSGDTVDVAFTRGAPADTANRKFYNVGGVTYQRIISKKENPFTGPIGVYKYPYDSVFCASKSGYHGIDGDGNHYCYYDSLFSFKYSTAIMFSKYKFKYGYFEMKYRLDNIAASTSNAYGPNWWMYWGDANAYYSELDFFEQRGKDWKMDANVLYRHKDPATYNGSTVTAWDTTRLIAHTNATTTTTTSPYLSQIANQLGASGGNWFTVGCEWTPEHLDFYYNSNDTVRRFSNSKLEAVSGMCAMPMIIDIYMPAFQYCIPFVSGQTQTSFNYDIDYIKVYQVKNSCLSKTYLNTSSATYPDSLWLNLTIGGSGGSAVFNSSTHHLAAQDYVLLQEGFEVSGASTTLIISTMPCPVDQTKTYNSISYPSLPALKIRQDINAGKTGLPND